MNESEVGNFLRLLTHDLQNQLGAVDLNLQIIPTLHSAEDPLMKTLLPFVSRASMASQDMIETLSDVQSFARSVSQLDGEPSEAPNLTRTNLSTKVRDCALILTSAAKNRAVTLLTAIEDDIMATVESEAVHRSIKILANEALRASFPDSTVVLSAFFSNSVPTVEISTTQEGVFDDHRPMLTIYLVRQLLELSQAKFIFTASENRSAIQVQFKNV